MNSTIESTNGPDEQSAETTGPYGYSIGISFGILLLLIVITYSYYVYGRIRARSNPNHRLQSGGSSINGTANTRFTSTYYGESNCSRGHDDGTMLNYPKLLYSGMKHHDERDCTASGCSICLQDYKDIDMLRILPKCGHFFHLKCVDPWLRLHPTCPICRNSPMPTALDTPVVE